MTMPLSGHSSRVTINSPPLTGSLVIRGCTMSNFCFLKRGKMCSPQSSLLHLDRTGSLRDFYAVLILLQHTALLGRSVWPAPGKKPRQYVDRTIFVAVPDESTIHTAIRAFP